MNKFIRKSLEPGEEIVHNGRLHWSYVAWHVIGAWALMIVGVLIIIFALNQGGSTAVDQQDSDGSASFYTFVKWLGILVILCGVFLRLWARILRTRTEFVVTKTRLIQKDGILSVSMTEIPLYKVESVEMRQGILDRIWNAGTIVLTGSGGTPHEIKHVYQPMEVRQAIVRNLKSDLQPPQPKPQPAPAQPAPASAQPAPAPTEPAPAEPAALPNPDADNSQATPSDSAQL